MTHSDERQFTISIADILTALGVSRTTLWRIFQGQRLQHTRFAGVKYFAVSDVIARLRQRPKHDQASEIILLGIDKNRRDKRQHKATKIGI